MISPFKFLDSYTKDDRAIFFGRDREIEELYQKIFESKILLVYGVSGTGKSSLIHCGLAGKFTDSDWLPINIRRGKNINESLYRAVIGNQLSVISKNADKESNTDYRTPNTDYHKTIKNKDLKNLYLDHFKPIFLIFDQFEELFIFGSKPEKEDFIKSVKAIVESDLQCRFLFVIREEYLAGITEFEKQVSTILSNRVRIEKMTRVNAQQAIEGPCKYAGIEVEPGFPELLLEKLSPEGGDVELTYLQVFLDKIFKMAVSENPNQTAKFNLAQLQKTGDVKDLLGSFLEEQIAQLPEPDAALVVLKAFVSTKGTKRQVNEEDVQDYSHTLGKNISTEALRDLIQRFISLRILRDKDESGRYELRHDALASKIYQKITMVEKELLEVRQFIENAHDNYQRRKIFLSAPDLSYIAPYEDKMYLSGELAQFVDQSKKEIHKVKRRRRNLLVATVVVLFVIFTGFTIWALNEKNKANEAGQRQLESILKLNESFEKAKGSQVRTKDEIYSKFQVAYMTSPQKIAPIRDKVQAIQKVSDDLTEFISSLQYEMISKSEKVSIDSAKNIPLSSITGLQDMNISDQVLFAEKNETSNIAELKKKIADFKNTIYDQIDKKDWDKIKFTIEPDKLVVNMSGDSVSWEDANFRNTILAGAVTNLTNLITEINYIEIDVINYIFGWIATEDFQFDTVGVKVIPRNNVVMQGEYHEADVMIFASNSKQNIEAYVFNSKESVTVDDYDKTEGMDRFISKNGIITVRVPSSGIGENKYAGFISLKKFDGTYNRFPFSGSFMTITPSVVISPTKMNVLYLGVNNQIDISAAGIPYDNLIATANNGKLTKAGPGQYILNPAKTGKLVVSVSAKINNEVKALGSMEFRVKKLPNPFPGIGEKKGGDISKTEITSAAGINILLEGFDWDIKFAIKNFSIMVPEPGGQYKIETTTGEKFSANQKKLIAKLKTGDYLFVKDINIMNANGDCSKLNDMIFKIVK